ncbi:MAG: restriction endonuclease subunit S [Selenomonadaceae bacterium]|nr:restriction endonuclease subunit S [Selenomonadaceae bacterium]
MTPEQLRNSILQMAIEGKLTEQRPEDGNAADLLKEIQAEKAKLVKDGVIKKEKPLPEIAEDEIPFEVPKSWCWCRLGEVGITITGKTPSTTCSEYYDGEYPFIGPGNISSSGTIQYDTDKRLTESGLANSRALDNQDIVQVCIGGSIGKVAIVDRKCGFNQQINAIKPLLSLSKYIFSVIQSDFFYKKLRENSTGTATPIINKDGWCNLLVPLATLAEQKRIVDRLEKILPLVDDYEKAYNELHELNKAFPGKLKNSLLQMAVEGKLTDQRPEDGNAADLLKEIQAEKAKLVKDGVIKKEKPLPEIAEDEIPFEIPESWCWVRMGNVVDVRDGTHDTPKYCPTGIPLVTSKNISSGQLSFDEVKYISEEDAKIINSRSNVDDGDILFAMIGSIGNPVIVKKNREFCIKNIALFKPYIKATIGMKYWFWVLYFFQERMRKGASGGVQSFVSLKVFRQYTVPLPPLAEQKRIVAKLEQLLPLCDTLAKAQQ